MYLRVDIFHIVRSELMPAEGDAISGTCSEDQNLYFLPVLDPPKKKKKTEEDGMLEKAFNISTASAAASAEDECRSFANFIANNLRNYPSRTRRQSSACKQ
jgi:hypothetical protein